MRRCSSRSPRVCHPSTSWGISSKLGDTRSDHHCTHIMTPVLHTIPIFSIPRMARVVPPKDIQSRLVIVTGLTLHGLIPPLSL